MTARKKRWDHYFMCNNEEFSSFWNKYITLTKPNIRFILGSGFDPRMCLGYREIIKCGGEGKRDILLIEYDEGPNSPSHAFSDLVDKNNQDLRSIIPSGSSEIKKTLKLMEDVRRVGSKGSAEIISSIDELRDYSDIVVDVSSLPKGIYFPLIGKILTLIDQYEKRNINLHILVSENFVIDKSIQERGIADDAEYIHGFKGRIESAVLKDNPKIWLPILGENQEIQLERIGTKINANEIFPLIPLPSNNPRRADNLIIEYMDLLSNRLNVDPKNILYVAEKNPFEVYRRISRTIEHVQEALAPLGGCTVTLSSSASKLLSIGALLAAYELKGKNVGVINVETFGYDPSEINPELIKTTELFSLWIAGDCYNTE